MKIGQPQVEATFEPLDEGDAPPEPTHEERMAQVAPVVEAEKVE